MCIRDSDYSAVELAAAFLKMQMGEEPQEIQEVIPEKMCIRDRL